MRQTIGITPLKRTVRRKTERSTRTELRSGLSAYSARVKDADEAEVMIERKARCNRNRLVVGGNNLDSDDLARAVEVNSDLIVLIEGLRPSYRVT